MREEPIAEVGINNDGGLYVRPARRLDFEHVYRAGMGVYWRPSDGALYGPPPREWSYADWFRQILSALTCEYGVALKLTKTTSWVGLPDDARRSIEALGDSPAQY